MMRIQEELTLENQLEKIASLLPRGYRFVTMTVVDCGDGFDVFYHFDLKYELETYRLKLPYNTELPSISHACFAALIVENEIQDLFGITVTGMQIDYHKHMLLAEDAPVAPFCRVPGVGVSAAKVETKSEGGAL
ncbi:hypothetical protein SDC9_149386 [bioreactor metagenome]|uniref:NADH:ubiquinone oxidoreductase 30kDa subunit domain-containing protein n=1 Tax=bioreactor metagenome TaxID=1076179 RepID=A0A645ELK4_9ZZZZ